MSECCSMNVINWCCLLPSDVVPSISYEIYMFSLSLLFFSLLISKINEIFVITVTFRNSRLFFTGYHKRYNI